MMLQPVNVPVKYCDALRRVSFGSWIYGYLTSEISLELERPTPRDRRQSTLLRIELVEPSKNVSNTGILVAS